LFVDGNIDRRERLPRTGAGNRGVDNDTKLDLGRKKARGEEKIGLGVNERNDGSTREDKAEESEGVVWVLHFFFVWIFDEIDREGV